MEFHLIKKLKRFIYEAQKFLNKNWFLKQIVGEKAKNYALHRNARFQASAVFFKIILLGFLGFYSS